MKSILAWILFVQSTTTIAFHVFPSSTRLSSSLARFVTSDFEGIIGESFGDYEGRKLAREFEREVNARRQVAERDTTESSNRRLLLSEDELRLIQQRAFSNRRQVVEGKNVMPATTTSAGFFTGRGQSVYSFPLDNPRGQQERDGHSLANNNNNSTPVLPILVALALLSIYMAVGLTGDVSETVQDWNGIGNVVSENVERVVPSAEGSALERVGPSVYL